MWGNYDDSGSAEAALHEAQLPAQLQREGVAGGGEVAPDGETDHTDLTPLSRLIPTAARLLEDRETVLLAELCSLMYAELGKERCQAAFIANAGGAAAFFMSRPEFQVSQQGTQGVSVALAKSESEGQTVPANKSKGDPEVSGLEPDVLRFLYGLNLLFGSNEWPQTRDELSARAGPFGTGIGSKLYQLSNVRIGAVWVVQGTHLHWSNDKVRQIIDATPQTIKQDAEAMLAEHPDHAGQVATVDPMLRAMLAATDEPIVEQDVELMQMGGFLYGPPRAVDMMSTLNVTSLQDVIELVAQLFSPLLAMSSDVRLAVRKQDLFTWCKTTGRGIRVSLSQAVEDGAVVVGGTFRAHNTWVGLPGPPRASTPSDVSAEFAPSETSSDIRRKAFNPTGLCSADDHRSGRPSCPRTTRRVSNCRSSSSRAAGRGPNHQDSPGAGSCREHGAAGPVRRRHDAPCYARGHVPKK